MKKLILTLLSIFIIVTIVSYVAINRKDDSTNNELEKNLVVYTTDDNAQMQFIAKQFKEATGITVDYKIVNNLDEALKTKGSNNVDVVYGGDENEFESMTNEDLLTPTKVSFSADLPTEYMNKDGYWYGTSLDPIVMFYNSSDMLPANAPTAWYQLAESTYNNRIILPDTTNFITQSALGSIIYQYSKSQVANESDIFLQGLKDNVVAYEPNEEDVINAMQANKEASISIGSLAQVKSAIAKGATFNVINPADGSPVIMQGIGVVKGAKNINSAKLFVEFLAGANMQLQLAQNFNIIPTLKTVLPYAPAWMANMDGLNIANVDWNTVNSQNSNLIAKYNILIKNPKPEPIKLELPVIESSLIPSQQKVKDAEKAKTEEEKNKDATKLTPEEQAAKAKSEAEAKQKAQAAQQQNQVTASQQQALQSLQSLGEVT